MLSNQITSELSVKVNTSLIMDFSNLFHGINHTLIKKHGHVPHSLLRIIAWMASFPTGNETEFLWQRHQLPILKSNTSNVFQASCKCDLATGSLKYWHSANYLFAILPHEFLN